MRIEASSCQHTAYRGFTRRKKTWMNSSNGLSTASGPLGFFSCIEYMVHEHEFVSVGRMAFF